MASSATSLTVSVPAGASYQPLSVAVNNLTGYSRLPFAVTFASRRDFSPGSFAPPFDSTTALYPNGIVMADFDGDGKADLATPNNFSISGSPASVSILRNTSVPKKVSFDLRMDIPSGVMTYAIATGDFNGDGRQDLVSSSIVDKAISVFRNTSTPGSISFDAKVNYDTGDNPYGIAVADLNGDGRPDLVVVNALSNTISVFKNTSMGNAISFAAKQDFMTDLYPNSIAVGDLDGDMKTDVAVTNLYSNKLSIFRNISAAGTILLATRTDIPTGNGPAGLTIADVNADEKPDIALAFRATPTVAVVKNNSVPGSISFESEKSFSVTGFTDGPYKVSMGDLNGDGKADMVVAGPSSFISILKNNCTSASISFSNDLYYNSSSPYEIAVNDIDGDGKPDLAAANFTGRSVSIIRNKINEPVIHSFSPLSGKTGDTIVIAGTNFAGTSDLRFGGVPAQSFNVNNSDTITAVIGTGVSGEISVATPEGSGAIAGFIFEGPPLVYSFSPSAATAGTSVYITGDNLVGTTEVLFGGTPAASFYVISPTLLRANLAAGSSGEVKVINNFGEAKLIGFTFKPIPRFLSMNPASGPVGTEITITGENFSDTPGENSVYFGASQGDIVSVSSTVIKVKVPTGTTFAPVQVRTGQGRFELSTGIPFVTTFAGARDTVPRWLFEGRTEVITNFTTGAFDPNSYISIDDLNEDGKPDLVAIGIKNYSHTVGVFHNQSTADSIKLKNVLDVSTPWRNTYDNAIADIDGDGKKDLILTEPGGAISVRRNTSTVANLSFDSGVDFTFLNLPYTLASGDVDGDGKTDLVIASGLGLNVLRNTSSEGTISFALPVPVPVLTNFTSGAKVYLADLDGDGKQDIILPGDLSDSHISIFRNTSSIAAISFEGKKSYAAGFYPDRLSIGDVDADAKADIVIAERGTNAISVMKNQSVSGTIDFLPRQSVVPYNDPGSYGPVALGDFDGDGMPDLATASCCGSFGMWVYKNTTRNGVISFASGASHNYLVDELKFADMDNDGKPDLVLHSKDSVTVLRNQTGEIVLRSFSPATAAKGGSVVLEGDNMDGATAVSFGGVPASSFMVNSPIKITAVVGNGGSGDVIVTTPRGMKKLGGFSFIPSPLISSFTPASAGTGATVTITGTNLDGATAVSFGGTNAASFIVNSSTSITAVVGAGTSGNIGVTAPGGSAIIGGFTFAVVTAIDPVPASSLGIRFYPNPTTGSFVIDTLKLSDKWEILEIFDTQGKKRMSNFSIKNKTKINVNVQYLSNGLYMAVLKRRTGTPTVIKFLKL